MLMRTAHAAAATLPGCQILRSCYTLLMLLLLPLMAAPAACACVACPCCPPARLPAPSWLPKASLIKQAFTALCLNEFQGATFEPDQVPPNALSAPGPPLPSPALLSSSPSPYHC